MSQPSVAHIEIALWKQDAIVLFDWLMKADLNDLPAEHKAVKQALTDLLGRLEETEVGTATQAEIDAAYSDVSKDMGW